MFHLSLICLFIFCLLCFFFFFNDTATTEIYTLSLHDALPIYLSAINESYGEEGKNLAVFQEAVDNSKTVDDLWRAVRGAVEFGATGTINNEAGSKIVEDAWGKGMEMIQSDIDEGTLESLLSAIHGLETFLDLGSTLNGVNGMPEVNPQDKIEEVREKLEEAQDKLDALITAGSVVKGLETARVL